MRGPFETDEPETPAEDPRPRVYNGVARLRGIRHDLPDGAPFYEAMGIEQKRAGGIAHEVERLFNGATLKSTIIEELDARTENLCEFAWGCYILGCLSGMDAERAKAGSAAYDFLKKLLGGEGA